MIIFVGSRIDQATIASSLGKPEYSYYFLLKDFIPALQLLGKVVQVRSIDEVRSLSKHYQAVGEQVVFFSFTSPPYTPLDAPCPTVCIFAWEFTSLPHITEQQAEQAQPGDWHANARNSWDYVFSHLQGVIASSEETAKQVQACQSTAVVAALPAPIWSRFAGVCPEHGQRRTQRTRRFSFTGSALDSRQLRLKPEHALPHLISEAKRLHNALLDGWWHEIRLPKRSAEQENAGAVVDRIRSLAVKGVVYTSVFNPNDGRKNWRDILSAFCWAFRDQPDATLILKITHNDLTHFRNVMINAMARSSPLRCRVIVLQAFLDDRQYLELIESSDYYVNASSGEGLCIPLMEFLSCGKPAIAPKHSAMADYFDGQCGFVVDSSLEPGDCPQDPLGTLNTYRRRVHWQSLVEQFSASFAQGNASQGYQVMSAQACSRLRQYSSLESVVPKLRDFIAQVVAQKVTEQTPA